MNGGSEEEEEEEESANTLIVKGFQVMTEFGSFARSYYFFGDFKQ